jgi:alpha-tubulin suppressor-like RCC1 family protein/5-hydroxyisourate hydrolase-like protein (transthyretin family)
VTACGESTAVSSGPVAAMLVVSGDEQAGTVGQQLANPLVVRVEDEDGNPLPQQIVNFVVVKGGGSVFAGANISNEEGIAQELWTLGIQTADSQVVEVRAVDNTTGQPRIFARFVATPLPDAPAAVTIVSGDAQGGSIGAALSNALVVSVSDQFGNPVPSQTVTWEVLQGGGNTSFQQTTTDANGQTSNIWTLGTLLNSTHSVRASLGNLTASFSATPQVPPGTTVAKLLGDAQTDTVNQVLPDSIVLRVTLADGRPVANATVTLSANAGSLDNSTFTTNADGRAGTRWRLGVMAGAQSVTATVADVGSVHFTATASHDAPVTMTKLGGDNQKGIVNIGLTDSLVLRVLDAFGNAVPGVAVTWSISSGNGSVQVATPATDGNGRVSASWSLGSPTGPQSATASASGFGGVFAATAFLPMIHVARGQEHGCGVLSDGQAICWGSGSALGNGTSSSTSNAPPAPVSGGTAFASVHARWSHTCGLSTGGAAYCWGSSHTGDGTTTVRNVPTPVSGGLTFTMITAGLSQGCGLTSSGEAHCWGTTPPTPVSGGLTFVSIDASNHTCGLTSAGVAYCWGSNQRGQLGDGTRDFRSAPVPVAGGLTFSAISVGANHTCGITPSGAAYCWGLNYADTPRAVPGGLSFTAIAASTLHTCGLVTGGAAYCWGEVNHFGQLGRPGDASRTPMPVSGGLTFASLATNAGGLFFGVVDQTHLGVTCGRRSTGYVYCWGTGGNTANPGGPTRLWP